MWVGLIPSGEGTERTKTNALRRNSAGGSPADLKGSFSLGLQPAAHPTDFGLAKPLQLWEKFLITLSPGLVFTFDLVFHLLLVLGTPPSQHTHTEN